MLKTRLGAALLAGLVSLTACSSSDGPTAGPTPDGSASATASPSGTSAGPVDAPPGFHTVTAAKSSVTFAVPDAWTVLDSAMLAAGHEDVIQEYATSLGTSSEDVRATLARVDLLTTDGRGEAINVLLPDITKEVESEGDIRAAVSAANGSLSKVTDATSPAGAGRLAYYSFTDDEGVTAYAAQLELDTGAHIVNLQVITRGEARTRSLVAEILPTISTDGVASASPAATGPAPSAGNVPAGYDLVTAPETHLQFAAPTEWTVLTTDDFDSSASSPFLTQLAKRLGTTVSELQKSMSDFDVEVLGPPEGNMNVRPVRSAQRVATPSELESMFSRLPGTTLTSGGHAREVDTPAGPAVVVEYTTRADGATIHGAALYLEAPSGVASLTISTVSAARTKQILDVVVATLDQVD